MTMHTVIFKQHQGVAHGGLPAVPARWSGLGSQPPPAAYGEAFTLQSKLASLELSPGRTQFNAANEDQQGLGKGNATQYFTLFSGNFTPGMQI
ncbi:hypothetical protein CDL12_20857 [Handroanthus impetiginosus]|uniref:Uncharacterized protein n=1 Tax=Handroanthus impetiginosus TaxID=429701 RepID=A0A2G9GMT4_9LAMI|nr:hypothetical protein CDL12_20857 [Handroanthus impetiginosus]